MLDSVQGMSISTLGPTSVYPSKPVNTHPTLSPTAVSELLGAVCTETSSQISGDVLIATKKVLTDKGKFIEVRYGQETGLRACIYTLNADGDKEKLVASMPLAGLPPQISAIKDIRLLKRFFEWVHLIPAGNQVSVHVSGQGGVQPSIPFQPGLHLGSIVKCDVLEKMENYIASKSKIDAVKNQINSIKQEITRLDTEIAVEPDATIKEILEAQKDMQKTLSKQCIAKFGQLLKDTQTPPIFEGFQQGLESPIDLSRSPQVVWSAGFDSLEFSSQYINSDVARSKGNNVQSHSASQFKASAKVGFGCFGAEASVEYNKAVSAHVISASKNAESKGVLLVDAKVTTRYVRGFEEIHYDTAKLRMILNAMNSNEKKLLDRYGITVGEDGKKSIIILTQATLGGSFTGIVTILNKSSQNMSHNERKEESQFNVSAQASYMGMGGKYSYGSQNMTHSIREQAESIANANIQIEIIAQGAIPSFAKDMIKEETVKNLGLNPQEFHLNEAEEAPLKTANGKVVGKVFTTRQIPTNAQNNSVYSISSVSDAYDDYSKRITSDQDCGIPIGFNYQILTQEDIQRLINTADGVREENPNNNNQNINNNNNNQNINNNNNQNINNNNNQKIKNINNNNNKNINNNSDRFIND